jgi:hypothetical protein
MKRLALAVVATALFAGFVNAATDEQRILDTVNTLYDGLRADDFAKFDSVISSEFYMYDVGKRVKHSLKGWLNPLCLE